MRGFLRAASLSLAFLRVVTGLGYPRLVTRIAQLLFPWQANGSLILTDGTTVGSALNGQPFDDLKCFWSRSSATTPFPDDAASSSGSNLGPTNPDLAAAVQGRIDALRAADPGNAGADPGSTS
jgi:K+-transporting ATPase ATPase C chain